jgi:hypothetical protein
MPGQKVIWESADGWKYVFISLQPWFIGHLSTEKRKRSFSIIEGLFSLCFEAKESFLSQTIYSAPTKNGFVEKDVAKENSEANIV